MKDGEDNFDNLIVVLNKEAYRLFSRSNKILDSYIEEGIFNFTPIMKYNDLCSYFLPNTKEPYPEIRSRQFKEHYSERVMDIYMNRNVYHLTRHIKKMNEFFINNKQALDEVPKINGIEWNWSLELRQSVSDVG